MTDLNNNAYSQMQKRYMDGESRNWSVDNRNPVVGAFDQHNAWSDYETLFRDIETKDKIALDFGCGPGRNIVKYWKRFARIDGADISDVGLQKARDWFKHNLLDFTGTLYCTNGYDLADIPDDTYDIVFSTICLQHICVHDIRFNLMKEFYRILKSGGIFTAQMGYGGRQGNWVKYTENKYDAAGTNGWWDVSVESPKQLADDLTVIGFRNFAHEVKDVGPGDVHKNWIYFRGTK